MEEPQENTPIPAPIEPQPDPIQPAPLPPPQPAAVQFPPPNYPPLPQQLPPPLPVAPPRPAPAALPHKTTDTLLAILSFVSAFLFFRWGAWGGPAGIAVTYGLFFAAVTAFAGRHAVRALRWDLLLSGATALALAFSMVIFDDPAFHALKLFVIVFLTAWYLCGLYQRSRYSDGSLLALLDIAALLVVWPFKYISRSTRTLFRGRQGKKSQLKLALIGIAAAIPVLVVAGVLLANADAAFEAALKRFADTLGESVAQLALAIVFFFPLFSLLFGLTRGDELEEAKPAEAKGGRMEPMIAASFLGAISLLYLCYLLTQLAYFFSGFQGLLPEGYTSAQYARRGFFELCAVAAINLGLLLLVSGVTRKSSPRPSATNNKLPLPVRILSAFVCAFTLMLIATAESKMVLYVKNFGMTRMRLMVSLFILLLAFAFILLLAQLFLKRFAYMKALLAAACLLMVAMSFADVDRVVLKYNVWAYQRGSLETLDVNAFNELGDAKIPYLIQMSYAENEEIRSGALEQLYTWNETHDWGKKPLTKFNQTQRQAEELMEAYVAREDCPLADYEPPWMEPDLDMRMF